MKSEISQVRNFAWHRHWEWPKEKSHHDVIKYDVHKSSMMFINIRTSVTRHRHWNESVAAVVRKPLENYHISITCDWLHAHFVNSAKQRYVHSKRMFWLYCNCSLSVSKITQWAFGWRCAEPAKHAKFFKMSATPVTHVVEVYFGRRVARLAFSRPQLGRLSLFQSGWPTKFYLTFCCITSSQVGWP